MNEPNRPRPGCAGRLALALILLLPIVGRAAEGDVAPKPPPPAGADVAVTNAAAEAQAAREAIEQLRRELEQNAARNADAITAGLSLIEPALARMQERQMEAVRQTVRETVRNSNQMILIVAAIFAAAGFLGLAFISIILVRAIGRFSEVAMASASRGPMLGGGHALPPLSEDQLPVRASAAEQVSGRFHGALEQLQRRIHELEQSLQPAAGEPNLVAGSSPSRPASSSTPAASPTNIQPLVSVAAPAAGSETGADPASSRITVLLGKGQALLNLDSAEEALQCFEEALRIDADSAEALVKKGMALEKLQEWDKALQNYNRAIAIDHNLTVAYLYRGGVYNRLQRYREALESYEQALRTEKSPRVS